MGRSFFPIILPRSFELVRRIGTRAGLRCGERELPSPCIALGRARRGEICGDSGEHVRETFSERCGERIGECCLLGPEEDRVLVCYY